jgi:hypothetical protein
MNIKALIAALVLAGTSTAALADPMVRDHRDEPAQTQVVRDHRDGDRDGGWNKKPSWMVLASSAQLTRGRDVIATNTKASTLKLVSLKGATTINQVQIHFANGATQTVSLGETLSARNTSLTIDLKGGARNVTKVTVFGKSSRFAAFQILAA